MSHDFVEAALMRRAGYHVGWWPTWWAATSSNRPTCWPNCSATAAGARATCKTHA